MARLLDDREVRLDFTESVEFLLDQALDLKGRQLEVDTEDLNLGSVTDSLAHAAELLYEVLEGLQSDDLDRPARRREIAGSTTSSLVKSPNARHQVAALLMDRNRRAWQVTHAISQIEVAEDLGEATDSLVTSLLDLSDRELHQVSESVHWHAGTEAL